MTGQTSPASSETRVILVDARPERRAVLRTVIEHADVGATVVGEAGNDAEAKQEVEQHAADLVIIDLHPPVEDSLATIAALRAWFPAVVILVCSFDPADTMGKRALASGADAYLLKPLTAREVMAAMREAPLHVREMEATVTPR